MFGKLIWGQDILSLLLAMNGFVTTSMFIYFTCQILDDGFCDVTNVAAFQRDPHKKLSFAQFI